MPEFKITETTVGALVILMISVSLHESAHAFTAHWLGDPTPRERGRVTLNPLKHLDPIFSVLVPAIVIFGGYRYLIAAGRPVPVSLDRMRRPDLSFAVVALAGPASNVLQALLFSALYVFLQRGETPIIADGTWPSALLAWGIKINIFLAFFNLLPVPPLDGSRLLAYLLPNQLKPAFYRLDIIGLFVLVVLFITGLLQQVMIQAYRVWDWWSDLCVAWAFG